MEVAWFFSPLLLLLPDPDAEVDGPVSLPVVVGVIPILRETLDAGVMDVGRPAETVEAASVVVFTVPPALLVERSDSTALPTLAAPNIDTQ
jgi:hypothetical protein